MGPQRHAMGKALFQSEPTFRAALETFDEKFRALSDWSLIDERQKEEKDSRMHETEVAQPANFFIQYGLTKLMASKGIHPDAVVGHSVGGDRCCLCLRCIKP